MIKSGYKGKDSMRAQAEKAIGAAVRGAEGPEKMSKSAPQNLKPRLYKKGGHVKKMNDGGLSGTMTPAMPIKSNPISPLIGATKSPGITQTGSFKKGGKVMKAKMCALGGSPGSDGSDMGYKKGGSVKKMAMGGVGKIRHNQATKFGKPMKARKLRLV